MIIFHVMILISGFSRSNPSQIFEINGMVTFYGPLNVYTFFDLPGISLCTSFLDTLGFLTSPVRRSNCKDKHKHKRADIKECGCYV